MASEKGNKKIAKKRGKNWKSNLIKGHLDSNLNPSILKMKRIKKDLSQTDMTKVVKLSLASYGAIERGKRPTNLEVANQIAKKLKLSKKTLFNMDKKGKYIAKKS